MHADLVRLASVHALDRRILATDKAVRTQQEALANAEAAVVAAVGELRALEDARAASRKEEHARQRKMHVYKERKQSALRVLQSGIGDPVAAERQVEQCETILDDIETELLEILEQQDELDGKIAAANAKVAEVRDAARVAQEQIPAEVEKLQGTLAELARAREAEHAPLDRQTQSRYETLRRRKTWAVAEIQEGFCSACRMVVRTQHVADIRRGLIVPCRGCHRWLVLPEEG